MAGSEDPKPKRRGRRIALGGLAVVGTTLITLVTTQVWEWGTSGSPEKEDPIQVKAVADPKIFYADLQYRWASFEYILPRPPARLTRPPELCHHRLSWAREQGGIDAKRTVVTVYVEGRDESHTVIMGQPTVRVTARKDPVTGTHAECPAGGPSLRARKLKVALDKSPPATSFTDEEGVQQTALPEWTLRKGDVEKFEIEADATRCLCEWSIELNYMVDGKRYTKTVLDNGKPFRTSGVGRADTYDFVNGRWKPSEPSP